VVAGRHRRLTELYRFSPFRLDSIIHVLRTSSNPTAIGPIPVRAGRCYFEKIPLGFIEVLSGIFYDDPFESLRFFKEGVSNLVHYTTKMGLSRIALGVTESPCLSIGLFRN